MKENFYEPNNITIKKMTEEKQNEAYAAGTFIANNQFARCRLAKTTPKKIGQFVAIWEKDSFGKNQPFQLTGFHAELLIITCQSNDKLGQFIFPKAILQKQKIYQTSKHKGRLGMRVYPSWDQPTNSQAKRTQKWQLGYFIDLSGQEKVPSDQLRKALLYGVDE